VAGERRNETRRKGDETGMRAFGRGGKKKDERRRGERFRYWYGVRTRVRLKGWKNINKTALKKMDRETTDASSSVLHVARI
jgi:hypothetical protein